MPLFVERLRIIGAIWACELDSLGDIDVELAFGMLTHMWASGRTFRSLLAEICWLQEDLVQKLRNRSGDLNITTENIDNITDKAEVVCSIADGPGAVRPPR